MVQATTDNERSPIPRNPSVAEVCLYNLSSVGIGKEATWYQACLFLFIAFCPIEDFVLQGTPLRGLGANLSIFPLCGLAMLGAVNWLVSPRSKVNRSVLVGLIYILFTSLYGLLLFGTWSQGSNLLWKGTTSLISISVAAFAAFQSYDDKPIVRDSVYVALALMCFGFVFGNSSPFGLPALAENGIMHFTPLPDFRPRGFASEPSEFSITTIAIGLLAVHVTRSRGRKALLLLLTLGLLVASGSKGGILVLVICVAVLSVIYWHSRWYQVAGLLLAGFPVALFLVWLIPTLFPDTLFSVSETIPTRVSMIICASMTFVHNPLGVGVTGFLPAVAEYLPGAMTRLDSLSPIPLSFNEVTSYVTSADMVSTKTFFFDQLMRFGLPFAICFFVYSVRLLRRLAAQNKTILLIAVLACVIALMTYSPGINNFAVAIVFGVALSEVKGAQTARRCE